MIARIEARGRDCGSRACGACRRQLHAPCPCKEISRGKLSLEDHSFVQESHSPCVLPPALGAIHKIQGDVVVHERALPGHLKRLSARHVHAPHGLSQGVLPFPSDRLGVASQKGRRLGFSIAVPRNEASFRGGIQIAQGFFEAPRQPERRRPHYKQLDVIRRDANSTREVVGRLVEPVAFHVCHR